MLLASSPVADTLDRCSVVHPAVVPEQMSVANGRTPHPPSVLRAGVELGRLLGGRYVLLDWLGRGGVADVFLGRDATNGELVAVKSLAREHHRSSLHRRRMLREGELGMRISHPNVVRTLDFGESSEGVPFVVLEPLVGETLHQALLRRGPSCWEEILPSARSLGAGLEAAHRAGVIHGDLTPSNVFLCGPPDEPLQIKLIDWGMAREPGLESRDHDGDTVGGTLEYLAPEQILADPIDPRTDVYGFGVLLFRWMTGEVPFDTPRAPGLLAHHLVSAAPPVSWLVDDIDPRVETLVMSALRKDPCNRYSAMTDLLEDLDRILEGRHDVHGAPLLREPDGYEARSEQGRWAITVLTQPGWTFGELSSVA